MFKDLHSFDTNQVLKYDGTLAKWIPGDDVAGSGGTGGTTNLTAGVIYDNHDASRPEHDESLEVLAGGTYVVDHTPYPDSEELRSVYIEKKIDVPGEEAATKKIIITASHPSGMTYNAFGGLKFRDSSNNIIPICLSTLEP